MSSNPADFPPIKDLADFADDSTKPLYDSPTITKLVATSLGAGSFKALLNQSMQRKAARDAVTASDIYETPFGTDWAAPSPNLFNWTPMGVAEPVRILDVSMEDLCTLERHAKLDKDFAEILSRLEPHLNFTGFGLEDEADDE